MHRHPVELLFQFDHPGAGLRVGGDQRPFRVMLFQVVGDFGGVAHHPLAVTQHRQGVDARHPLGAQPVRPRQQIAGAVRQPLMVELPAGFLAVMGYRKLVEDAFGHGVLPSLMRPV